MLQKLEHVKGLLSQKEIWVDLVLASHTLDLSEKTIRTYIQEGKIDPTYVKRKHGRKIFINISPFFIENINKLENGIKNQEKEINGNI